MIPRGILRLKSKARPVTHNYKLKSVIVHSGHALSTGHYITYAPSDNHCIIFDDSIVTQTARDVINSVIDTPYALFYQRASEADSRDCVITLEDMEIGRK